MGAAALKQLGAELNTGALCKAATAALSSDAPALEDTYYAAELLSLAGCAALRALSQTLLCALCLISLLVALMRAAAESSACTNSTPACRRWSMQIQFR